jgi:hypothetical protein
VEEQVFCSSCVNESETLVRQFLDTAFSHLIRLLLIASRCPACELPTGQRRLIDISIPGRSAIRKWGDNPRFSTVRTIPASSSTIRSCQVKAVASSNITDYKPTGGFRWKDSRLAPPETGFSVIFGSGIRHNNRSRSSTRTNLE